MSLEIPFLCCFVFTMWALKLLAFMDCFYVFLKVAIKCGFVFTVWALKLLALMY